MQGELFCPPAQARSGGPLDAQVDGSLLLAGEEAEIDDTGQLARASRDPRELLQQRLEQQAFVDRLDGRDAGLRKSPCSAGRAMEPRPPPVTKLAGAGNDGAELVAPAGEPADALQRVGRQLLLGGELRFIRHVLQRASTATLDDGARRIDVRGAPLDDAQGARPLETPFSGQLRLDAVPGRGAAQEDDAPLVAGQRLAAMHDRLGLQYDFHAGARERSCESFSTI